MSQYGGISETPHVISNQRGFFYSIAGSSGDWTSNEDLAEKYPERADMDTFCNILRQDGHDCFVL
jgi:hypothetical protein